MISYTDSFKVIKNQLTENIRHDVYNRTSESIFWYYLKRTYLSLSFNKLISHHIIIITLFNLFKDFKLWKVSEFISFNFINNTKLHMLNTHINTISVFRHKLKPVLKRYNTRVCIYNQYRISRHLINTFHLIQNRILVIYILLEVVHDLL